MFLDFTNAFDSVWYDGLLLQTVHPVAFSVEECFVRVGSDKSLIRPIFAMIPQGSLLRPDLVILLSSDTARFLGIVCWGYSGLRLLQKWSVCATAVDFQVEAQTKPREVCRSKIHAEKLSTNRAKRRWVGLSELPEVGANWNYSYMKEWIIYRKGLLQKQLITALRRKFRRNHSLRNHDCVSSCHAIKVLFDNFEETGSVFQNKPPASSELNEPQRTLKQFESVTFSKKICKSIEFQLNNYPSNTPTTPICMTFCVRRPSLTRKIAKVAWKLSSITRATIT